MSVDVKFSREEGSFKLRVCGVVQLGDKYLISKSDKSVFYGYPGGHVMLGENTDEAVIREVKEETKIDTNIVKLLGIIQLFFDREDGKPFHEIGYYYLLKPKGDIKAKDYSLDELDHGTKMHYDYKWLTVEEMEKCDLRPANVKEILSKNLDRQHIIRYQKDYLKKQN